MVQIAGFFAAALSILNVDYTSLLVALRTPPPTLHGLYQAFLPILPLGHAVQDPYEPLQEDDPEDPTDSSGRMLLLQQNSVPRQTPRYLKALTVLTILTWVFSVYLAIFPGGPPSPPAALHLDKTYNPTSSLDIVISMYDEPLPSLTSTLTLLLSLTNISPLSPRLFVYTKNYHADLEAIAHAIPASLPSPSITLVPNTGREGHTYLHHILSHWDTLGNHTLFLQAATHNPRELGPRIRDFFGPDTGMLPLGFAGYSCPCDADVCSDRFWEDASGIVRETYLKATRRETCASGERVLLSYKGQFVASAARIRGTDRALYEGLYGLFEDAGSWVHREPYLAGRTEEMSAPVFGFTMERMWAGLLQCGAEGVSTRCPSLLSGWRTGGDRGDCQCFDHA
ncbi:hypothetical protein CAC42_3778 [Sphaceloma murrayae]|uniref:Uncharacterized protein n=1 Tax=Sphaceloma murrayae TaxID=2082308 RepID=A0A2K1QHY6_9PEZI|nr:hypothetical protein CAC42_3778 [Sphaceloma murrayae]